jgi:uncharacterized protein (TIGR02231 family)
VSDTKRPAPIDVVAPIARVTVFEDRADIVREAPIVLPGGASVLRIDGLPAVVSDDHVTAHLVPLEGAGEANVNDVRVERLVVSEVDPQAARRLERAKEIEALEQKRRVAEERYESASARRASAEVALQRWSEQLALAVGRGNAGDDKAWRAAFDAFAKEMSAADVARAAARKEIDARRREAQHLGDDARAKPTGQKTVSRLILRVSAPSAAAAGGRYRLVVSTLVPCAAWRPTHEAVLVQRADEPARVRFTTYACVWQATGEDWRDVDIALSTARPSAGAELPPVRADRLTVRTKTPEERKTIVAEHREENIPQSATQGTAPGVDDGGQPRTFNAPKMNVKSDGRPHRAQVATFDAPCTTERIAVPELASQVFLRASLKNAGASPILAGSCTLVVEHAAGGSTFVGTGDIVYAGPGESFDLSFGSDDRFLVRTKKRRIEDKKLVGKDVVHFVREATLTQTGRSSEKVTVLVRMPTSEEKQIRVLPSPQHCTEGEPKPDEHGIVRIPIELAPNVERRVAVAFSFETSGDVRIPDPW